MGLPSLWQPCSLTSLSCMSAQWPSPHPAHNLTSITSVTREPIPVSTTAPLLGSTINLPQQHTVHLHQQHTNHLPPQRIHDQPLHMHSVPCTSSSSNYKKFLPRTRS